MLLFTNNVTTFKSKVLWLGLRLQIKKTEKMNISKLMTIALVTVVFTLIITSCNQHPNNEVSSQADHLKTYKMGLKENKALVAEFIEAMRVSNVEKLSTMITGDFSWWIIGKPEYLATAGEHDTEYFLGFFKGDELFPEGADFKAVSMIAEGNKVAAEAEFKAKTASGAEYENYYHFLFIIKDGKIKRMKEYMDTYHAKITFGL